MISNPDCIWSKFIRGEYNLDTNELFENNLDFNELFEMEKRQTRSDGQKLSSTFQASVSELPTVEISKKRNRRSKPSSDQSSTSVVISAVASEAPSTDTPPSVAPPKTAGLMISSVSVSKKEKIRLLNRLPDQNLKKP